MSYLKLFLWPFCVAVIFAVAYGLMAKDQVEATTEQAITYYDDEARLSQAGSNQPDADTAIAFWQKRVADSPRAYIEYTLLGEAFARKARETGDAGYYQRAEAALHRALEINPNYGQSSALLAGVLFSMHNFEEALKLATAVADQPKALSALATVGDVQLALGRYEAAEATYQKLFSRSPSPAVYSRLAAVARLHGETEQALALMQQALNSARQAGESGESLAWYSYQLGDFYFNVNQLDQAEKYFAAARTEFNNYYLALAALAKVRAAQGSYAQAIELYQKAVAIIPQPEFLAALGDVYTVTGQLDQAQRQYDTVEYIGQLAKLNQQIYNRQLANFYADHNLHLDVALKLATTELKTRQDIYGLDTAAWAYYKNGRFEEAQRLIEQALQLGTRDAKLFYHAGMIALALNRPLEAERFLADALAINPHFDLLQAPLARQALEQLQAK
jgi:tetratricopeptide (TPR) repeat protein